jgi:Family of unknown function (DUF6884)
MQARSDIGEPDATLVGCVSLKNRVASAAKDLYRSELFRRRRMYAEQSGRPWLIISALHGLVEPSDVLEPYNVSLKDLSAADRTALDERIVDQLEANFGSLRGRIFEVHAGDEYVVTLQRALRTKGVVLLRPLRGLRIGEQLAWYGQRLGLRPGAILPRQEETPIPPKLPPDVAGLAHAITQAFVAGSLDLSRRAEAPTAGWLGMPERIVAERLRSGGGSDVDVRLLLTFTAAMDRAREADRLWFASERLFHASRWVFDPDEVARRPLLELGDALGRSGVSQRHSADAAAWRTIGEALAGSDRAGSAVREAIFAGKGDAKTLLEALQARTAGGSDLFPFLRGPKIGPMWVRMIAYPGGADIASLDVLPVAVDVQVRKVTEYLGVADTAGLDLELARPVIQALWAEDVRANGASGPSPLDGTAAALDPALWFWGKWGCTRCEWAGKQLPISPICGRCRFSRRGSTDTTSDVIA